VAPSDRIGRIDLSAKEAGVAKYGRNDSCPCRSGKKAKRCCGVDRGPGAEELARAFLASEAQRAAPALAGVTDEQFDRLLDELHDLPALDLSLTVRLPDLLGPDLAGLLTAVARIDLDGVEDALPGALIGIDSFERRAELARAVLALRESSRVGARLAALALVDLAGGGRTLLRGSLLRAATIATGRARTPAGLLVAAA
jgi:SEC-C motif